LISRTTSVAVCDGFLISSSASQSNVAENVGDQLLLANLVDDSKIGVETYVMAEGMKQCDAKSMERGG
jgi:hypothetical protein